MTIGVLQIDLRIHGSRSLKDKRRVLKSIKDRARTRFNCSIAEVDFKDQWGRARLAVCVVGDDSRFVNTQLNEIVRFASTAGAAELLDYQIEML